MEELINYEEEAKKAAELVSEEVVKKAGINPVVGIGLATVGLGVGYAAFKGIQKLIAINKEKKAFRPGNMDTNDAADADFEPEEA